MSNPVPPPNWIVCGWESDGRTVVMVSRALSWARMEADTERAYGPNGVTEVPGSEVVSLDVAFSEYSTMGAASPPDALRLLADHLE